jgi:hypothetical protein
MSNSSCFDKTHRTPVDIISVKLFSKGVSPLKVNTGSFDSFDVCPPLHQRPLFSKPEHNLRGKKFGRFVVIGMHKHKLGRWVVKCSCGKYELRTARAINNPINSKDKCVFCRKLDVSKRCHEYRINGFNFEDLPKDDK